MFTNKLTTRIAKFASILALSTGLIATGTTASFAGGPPKPLIGALVGGAAGAGIGFVGGKGQGALIGGILGLAAGALLGDQLSHHDRGGPEYAGYVPPPPPAYAPTAYAPAPAVYQAPVAYQAPVPVAYQPSPYGAPVTDPAACRQFNMQGGYGQDVYQTACLQPDGTWRVVN